MLESLSINLMSPHSINVQDDDLLVLMISDRNPRFNPANLNKIAQWILHKKWRYVNVLTTGSLQKHSIAIEQQVKHKQIHLNKIERMARKTERVTTNRIINIFSNFLSKINPQKKCNNITLMNPEWDLYPICTRDLRHDIHLKIKEINEMISLSENYFKKDLIFKSIKPHKELTDLLSDLNGLISLSTRKNICSKICNKENNNNYIDSLMKNDTINNTSFYPKIWITPWESIAGKYPSQHYLNTLQSINIQQCLNPKEMAFQYFKAITKEITNQKLDLLKSKTNYPVHSSDYPIIYGQIEEYLIKELTVLQMILNTMRDLPATNNKIFIAYPMQSHNGNLLFKLINWLNRHENKFHFIDITELIE